MWQANTTGGMVGGRRRRIKCFVEWWDGGCDGDGEHAQSTKRKEGGKQSGCGRWREVKKWLKCGLVRFVQSCEHFSIANLDLTIMSLYSDENLNTWVLSQTHCNPPSCPFPIRSLILTPHSVQSFCI